MAITVVKYTPLSNMALLEEPIIGAFGMRYRSVEHAYQAAKAVHRKDAEEIASIHSPYEARKHGRWVELRSDWKEVRDELMQEYLVSKFTNNPDCAEYLLNTGDNEIKEINNWHDYYWGCTANGEGKNKLGIFLMAIRESLRELNQ